MRVFIGVELSHDMRGACAQMMRALSQRAQGRWTLEENLHMTLAFIGQIDPAQLGVIEQILREAAAQFAPMRLSLSGAGVFEKKGGAILHARIDCEGDAAALHDFLIGALRRAGLPADPGPFAPHVTLARKAQIAGDIGGAFSQAAFTPAYLTLFESARDAQGVLRYTPLKRCAWRNGANDAEN